jgi:hypothetical protein
VGFSYKIVEDIRPRDRAIGGTNVENREGSESLLDCEVVGGYSMQTGEWRHGFDLGTGEPSLMATGHCWEIWLDGVKFEVRLFRWN